MVSRLLMVCAFLSLILVPAAAQLAEPVAPVPEVPAATTVPPAAHEVEPCRPSAIPLASPVAASGPTDPVTGRCDGIRPGARVNGCTMSWILTDGTDLYGTIAGHCARLGDRVTLSQTGRTIGTMVYSVDQPIGEDFGVFKIDNEDVADVSPSLCGWAGPTGMYEAGTPVTDTDPVVHHFGYGIGFGSVPPVRARTGVFHYENGAAFAFQGAASPGDSGSPARLGDGLALGVITDLTTVRTPGTGPLVPADKVLLSGTVAGTLLDHGLDRVQERLGLTLTLVTAPLDPPIADAAAGRHHLPTA